jgi:DNA-binding GntR family transcriptional regulator
MNARTAPNAILAQPALYERVAEQLRARIFAHELAPGSWLDEQALAAEFGISRTPLREALKVLAAEGLVTLKPRRGCYVSEPSEEDLDGIFPIIALLEGRCAQEATQRATAADVEHLAAIHAQLEASCAAHDADAFFEINQAFHNALQELAGNPWLQQLIGYLRKVAKLTRRDSLRLEGRLRQSLAEHRTILQAIRGGRSDEAGRLMHDHILSGRSALAKLQRPL